MPRQEVYHEKTGVIKSPSWPSPYAFGRFPWSKSCSWRIETKTDEQIQLNVMDFNLEDNNPYRISCEKDDDLLKISGMLYKV